MGRWGEGNFDDDHARDYLVEIIAGHEQFVERIFAGDLPEKLAKMNFYDLGECYLVPTLSIIHALHTSLDSDYLPNPETIVNWKNKYFHEIDISFDMFIDDLGTKRWFQDVRRPVIEATFKGLLESSKELYERYERVGGY